MQILLLTLCSFAYSQEKGPGIRHVAPNVPDHYIVVLSGFVKGRDVAPLARSLVARHGGDIEHIYRDALNGFSIHASEATALAIARDPLVDLVEEDGVAQVVTTQFSPDWGLDRIDQHFLPLDNAYTYDNTGFGVNVYVIDSGIRFTHQDFGGRAVLGEDEIGDGQNGNDCFGHGTHVSGTIGGATYGVAKNVTLISVRVFNCSGGGSTSGIIAGVDFVLFNFSPPAVANMSLKVSPGSSTLDTAIRNAIASGVTFTIAAGNDNTNASNDDPARVSQAITVAATDASDNRASFSNFGSVVDVFAPGVNITSDYYLSDTSTAVLSGTSMAAPHVAGVVALYLQSNPLADPATVQSSIINTATQGVVVNPGTGSPNRLLYSGFAGQALYYLGTNQHVNELFLNGNTWTNGDVSAATGGTAPSSTSALTSIVLGGSHAVYYVGTDQHVHELFWNGSAWSNGDVSAATGAPAASATAGLTSFVSGGSHAVYFVGTDQHVHELFWNGSVWTTGDLIAATGGTPATSTAGLTSIDTSPGAHAVYYVGTDQHVYALFWNGAAWSDGDLTAATGGTLSGSASGLTSILIASTTYAIYYEGTDQHVYELFWNGGPAWTVGDVTAATGGALAAPASALTSFLSGGTTHAIYYIGTNQHAYELFWNGVAWSNGDVTAVTGNVSASGNGITCFTTAGGPHGLYYVGSNQHLRRLYWNGVAWTGTDITSAAGTGSLAELQSLLTSF